MATWAHAATGLSFVESQRDGVSGVGGLGRARALALSPDGVHLYAAGEGDDSLVVFRRDALSGKLTLVERQRDGDAVDGLDGVRAVAISPDGAHVYAAGDRDDAVPVFARNATTGALTFVEIQRDTVGGVAGLDGVEAVIVSPDGAHVYALSDDADSVVVFRRDPASGGLTFVEVQRDGVGLVSGMNGAEGVAISPDGAHLYVAAPADKAVVAFQRNPTTGALTFVGRWRDGLDGVLDGLDGVRSLTISADGLHVYAAGKLDDAVAVFNRDPATGALTFVARWRDGVDGVDGLDGVESIALSPDGTLLYSVASDDDAVAVFRRDASTGTVTFLHHQRDQVGNVQGFNGPKALATSPDGVFLYVATLDDDAVVVFSSRCGDGTRDADERCDDANALAGDGCSPGCRLECAAGADCDDGDVCTEDICRGGACVTPRCGFDGALCELGDIVPVVGAAPECGVPTQAQLGRTIRRKIGAARRHLLRARRRKAVDKEKLLARVAEILARVERKSAKLEARGLISSDCRQTVEATLTTLDRDLAPILLRRGLCPG